MINSSTAAYTQQQQQTRLVYKTLPGKKNKKIIQTCTHTCTILNRGKTLPLANQPINRTWISKMNMGQKWLKNKKKKIWTGFSTLSLTVCVCVCVNEFDLLNVERANFSGIYHQIESNEWIVQSWYSFNSMAMYDLIGRVYMCVCVWVGKK